MELVWPYFNMEKITEKIYNLKKDEVIPPIEMKNGTYIYCANNVFYLENAPFEKIKPFLQGILKESERKALSNAFYYKINSNVASNIDNNVCDRFMIKYNIEMFKDFNDSSRTKTLNAQFDDLLKDTILEYSINSKKFILTVEDLLNHYSNSSMLSIFNNRSDLEHYLYKFAAEEYMLQLADSLGISKTIKHNLDKKNYKNKTILSFYEARELMPQITVSDSEVKSYYRNNRSEFSSGETAEISLYSFDTEKNAYIGRMSLMRNMKNIPQDNERKYQYKGLKQLDSNVTVTRTDNKYSKDIIRAVFQLKDDQYSQPIKLSSDFIIIKKCNETGSMIKPIEEVREDIFNKIRKMKCDRTKNDRILAAKKNIRPVLIK
jgi:peptidyl-prolyl cis-trans isomerase C